MSKLVKILLSEDVSVYDYDDYMSKSILRESISDWEEISDDDFSFLRDNIWSLRDWPANCKPLLLVKDEMPVMDRITSIKAEIDLEQKRKAAKLAEKRRKELERQQAKLLKKADSEKALLERLKSKYESGQSGDPV